MYKPRVLNRLMFVTAANDWYLKGGEIKDVWHVTTENLQNLFKNLPMRRFFEQMIPTKIQALMQQITAQSIRTEFVFRKPGIVDSC